MPRDGCNADSICRRAELLVMTRAGRGFMDRYVDSIPAGLFPSCVIPDQWSPCSECSSLSWIITHFSETIMAQLGVGPSQERLPVCFGSSLPPCSTPRAVGRRNWGRSQLGTQQAWPNLTLRGRTLKQDCGPRGELRGGLPSAEG